MQHLWETHVHDLHGVIDAEVHDLPDTSAKLEKSLMDVDKLVAALAPFYGQEAADSVGQLLKEHELAAYEYVLAAEAGDQAAMQAAMDKSAEVVDRIAQCLSSLNPNWPYEAVRELFQEHVDDLKAITDLMVAQDTPAALLAVDEAIMHARLTADVMSDGLVAQFPDRFGR